MNKKIIFVLTAVVLIIAVFCSLPIINYTKYFSKTTYYVSDNNVEFKELFYEPESKECEIYGIGNFGYIDIAILTEHPEEIYYYNEHNIKIVDSATIDELMNLLRQCTFIPIERNDAFFLSCYLNNKNSITSLNVDSLWFDDEYNSLFSKTVVDEINEQCFGISECTIFEHDNKLYLLGAYANKMIGGSYLKYERPSFAETLTVMYEIEMSDEAKKILQSKDKFYPGKDNIWCIN